MSNSSFNRVGQIPTLYWLRDFLSPVLGNRFNFACNARHGGLRTFASQEVEKRKGRGSDHQDIVDKLLEVQRAHPDEMNDASVLSMATSNISAGSDTTAISTRAIIYHLLKNPECKQKLVAEIDARIRDGTLSEPISLGQTKGMPYLQACLYEGLRCHPVVGMSLPRVTPAGGVEIDGIYIPEGVSRPSTQTNQTVITFLNASRIDQSQGPRDHGKHMDTRPWPIVFLR